MYECLEDYKELSIEKIEEIEKEFDIKLPPLYKTFIAKYNGAFFKAAHVFSLPEDKGFRNVDEERLEHELYALSYFLKFENFVSNTHNHIDDGLNIREFIPIMTDKGGAYYFICIKEGEYYGKIFFDNEEYEYSCEGLYLVADSIEDFLACIINDYF